MNPPELNSNSQFPFPILISISFRQITYNQSFLFLFNHKIAAFIPNEILTCERGGHGRRRKFGDGIHEYRDNSRVTRHFCDFSRRYRYSWLHSFHASTNSFVICLLLEIIILNFISKVKNTLLNYLIIYVIYWQCIAGY